MTPVSLFNDRDDFGRDPTEIILFCFALLFGWVRLTVVEDNALFV